MEPPKATDNKTQAEWWKTHVTGKGTLEEPYTYKSPQGVTYCWNPVSNTWEALVASQIAQQQTIYDTKPEEKKNPDAKSKKQKKEEIKQKKKTGSVYVTGLPDDISETEIVEYFSKCGLLKKDEETAQPKVKVYKDEQGNGKGDALVCYYRPESVDIAIEILDETEIRSGFKIRVQPAVFEAKEGEKNKRPKKKKKISKKIKLYDQSKELSWAEDDNKHVVIKHLFVQSEAWSDPNFFQELEKDIITECEKLGTVEKVKIFERNPEGIVVVIFEDHESADKCVHKMNGRYFAGRQLEADFYDGWTDFNVRESEEQRRQRVDKFGEWLGNDEDE